MTSMSLPRALRTALALMTAAAALAPVTASALDTKLVPSIGADTGRFTLPISCGIKLPEILGNVEVIKINGTVDIEGIAPVQLGPGQVFYLSQGKGALTLPAWLSSLGGLVTINKADAVVDSLKIGATRSNPATVDLAKLYDLSVKDVPVTAGKDITVGLPKSGNFLVGPYVAPVDGRVQFRFEGATANVKLKSQIGLVINVRAECAASRGNALLSVAVGPQIDPSRPARFDGEPLAFPKVAAGNLVGIVNAPYKCTIAGQQYDVGIAVGAVIPLAVQRFGSIAFKDASGAITLPAATVNRLLDAGITTLQGKVDELRLIVDRGTPANPNVLPNGTDLPLTTLQRDTPVVLSLPTTGTVTAGPFRPNWLADTMVVGLGSAAATLQFNGNGEAVKVTCPKPEPDALLVDAPIL
jgi:hypothetical protein